jgi:hypothetical protein
MMKFFQLNKDILSSLCTEWLPLKNLGQLTSALCNHSDRSDLFSVVTIEANHFFYQPNRTCFYLWQLTVCCQIANRTYQFIPLKFDDDHRFIMYEILTFTGNTNFLEQFSIYTGEQSCVDLNEPLVLHHDRHFVNFYSSERNFRLKGGLCLIIYGDGFTFVGHVNSAWYRTNGSSFYWARGERFSEVFTGSWNDQGWLEDNGRQTYVNGEYYIGKYKYNYPHEQGKLYSVNETLLYDGNWYFGEKNPHHMTPFYITKL